MKISLKEIEDIFTKRKYPMVQQLSEINVKYQEFVNDNTNSKNKEISLIHVDLNNDFAHFSFPLSDVYGTYFSQENYQYCIDAKLKESEIKLREYIFPKKFLENYGIKSNQYDIICFYSHVAHSVQHLVDCDSQIVAFRFNSIKVYLVIFDESLYNFIRLTYSDEISPFYKLKFDRLYIYI